MPESKLDRGYASPEIVRVGDARELTLGRGQPVCDLPGEPDAGYFDSTKPAERQPQPESPGE